MWVCGLAKIRGREQRCAWSKQDIEESKADQRATRDKVRLIAGDTARALIILVQTVITVTEM